MKIIYRITNSLILCFFISFSSSCSDNNEGGYVPGELLFQAQDTATFSSVSDLIFDLQLTIKELYEYRYLTINPLLTTDSLKDILKTKPYLNNGGKTFVVTKSNDTLFLNISFFDLDSSEATDWLSTTIDLDLHENPQGSNFKWGIIKVPAGNEIFYLHELNHYPILKHVQFNHLFHL